MNYINGEYLNIHYGDILIKFQTIKNCDDGDLPYINKDVDVSKKNSLLIDGDVVMADTAEDYAAGKAIEVFNVKAQKIISGLHTIPLRPKIKFYSGYLGYYLNSRSFKDQIHALIQGIKVYSISKTALSSTYISFPDVQEQAKIAILVKSIDEKICVQNKIIEDLLLVRKGIIESFFSVSTNSASLSIYLKERKTYSEKGEGYEHVTLSKEGICPKTDRYDRDFLVKSEDKNYKITKLNDICYNPANLKFRVICLNDYGNAIFSPIYVTFEVKNIDPYYLSLYLTSESFIKHILRYQQGTVYERMSVGPEDFCKGKIPIKNSFEIENFIKGIRLLDKKIKLEKSVLNDFNIQKNYLLNNLFI